MPVSFNYDPNYYPAAPVIQVGLSPSGGTESREVLVALVDSGADATMVPVATLRRAGARYVEQRQMRGVVGGLVTVKLYLTAVHIAGYAIHGVRAIAAASGTEAIIGRDVLNQLELLLNGPAHELFVK